MYPDPNVSDETYSRLMTMLDTARQYMLDGLYEPANELLEQVKSETQFDPAYKDLYKLAERISADSTTQRGDAATKAREALTKQLNTAIGLPQSNVAIQDPDDGLRAFQRLENEVQDVVDQWNQTAQQHLGAWRQSLALGKEDNQLKRFSDDVNYYATSEKRRLYVDGVERVCEALYARADELMNTGDVAPATILRYYDAVQSIVRDAAGKEERLEPLRQRAEQRRTERALANVTYTSAVQGEQYESELQRLRGMKAGTKVPRTRFAPDDSGGVVEVSEGYIPVEEAIQELEDLARNWAGIRLLEYLDRANTLLREHNPKAAETSLIEDAKKINTFIFQKDREDIEAKLSEIRAAKSQLERANRLASEARDLINATSPSPLAAWERLQNAIQEYEWASEIGEAQRAINNHLSSTFNALHRKADSLIIDRDLQELRALVRQAENNYGGIKDSIATVEIEALQKKLADLEQLEQSKLTATTEMQRIRVKAAENPLGAESDLADFRAKNARILNEIPEFHEVEAVVMRSMGAQQTADRLDRDMNNQILDQVSDAVKLGREALKQYPDHTHLKRVVANLAVHETFLRGRQADGLKKFEDAYKHYSQVTENPAHPDYIEANAAVERLRRQQDGDNIALDTLEHAREMMHSDPIGAFQLLRNLNVYSEQLSSDLSQQRNLARTLALSQIQQRMKAAQGATKIPIEQIQEDLNALQLMNWNDEYESWSALFNHAMAAQRAESLSTGPDEQQRDEDLSEAIKEWESAIRFAEESKAKELATYRSKLAQVRRRYASIRLTTLRSEIAIEGGESQHLDHRIAELEDDLKMLIEMSSMDGEIQLWRAQLGEAIGRYSLSPAVRETQFRTAQIFAESAQQLLKDRKNAELQRIANELAKNAQVSLNLAAVMKQIEPLLISKEVASVREAVDLYQGNLEAHTSEEYHAKIREWWDTRVKQALREKNDAPVALIRPDGSVAYDRLTRALLINPGHTQASDIMKQIDTYWANDSRRLNALVSDENKAAQFNEADGWARLDKQIKRMESFLQDLNALAELKRTFATHEAWGTRLSAIQMHRFSDLKDTLDRLAALQDKLQAVTYTLVEDTRTGQFENSEALLREVEMLRDHPAYQQKLAEIETRRRTRVNLQQTLAEIQTAISAGCFHDAYARMSTLDEGTIANYGLYNSLNLRTADRGIISDWSDLEMALAEKAEVVRTILAYALPFGIRSQECSYDSVSGSSITVIDWEKQQHEIRVLVEQGKFSLARAQLEDTLRENTAYLNLQQAINRLENPPYSSVELTVADRYRDARQKVQFSPAALAVLQAMQSRLNDLYTHLKSAQGDSESSDEMLRAGEIAQIDLAEQTWDAGWRDWELAIREIAAQFDTAGGVKAPRVDDRTRRGFVTAVEKAQAAYEKCARICPHHPYLNFMRDVEANEHQDRGEGHYLFWRAAQLVNGQANK